MSILVRGLGLLFVLSSSTWCLQAQTDEIGEASVFKMESPPAVIVRFNGIERKYLEEDQMERRSLELESMIRNDDQLKLKRTQGLEIAVSSEATGLFRTGLTNGLLGSMYLAYSEHLPLVIRPDEVWLTITASLANYVNNNSERLRSKFVKNTEEEELVVRMVGSLYGSNESFWAEFTRLMEEEMSEFLQDDLDWMIPDFSTTTERDRLVGRMISMGALKNYFRYKGIFSCGLPQLTLLGELEDWEDLKTRAQEIGRIDSQLKTWIDVLIPVLDQFVNTYQGQVDPEFWQRMVSFRPLGSGGQKHLRGWFMALSPFDGKGRYQLNTAEEIKETGIYAVVLDDAIYQSTVSVPVKLDDNGVERDIILWGGVAAPVYNRDINSVRPSVEFAVAEIYSLEGEELAFELLSSYRVKTYEDLDENQMAIIAPEEFERAFDRREKEFEKRREEIQADRLKRNQEILSLPEDERLSALVERQRGSVSYQYLDDEFKALFTEEQIKAAVAQYREDRQKAQEELDSERTVKWRDLPKFELLQKLARHYYNFGDIPEELRALVDETNFQAYRDLRGQMSRNEDKRWR